MAQDAPAKLRIARGPYLQDVRRDAAFVCFWTSADCAAKVTVGDRVFAPGRASRHTVELTGLKEDLAASKAPFKIVFWHHAPYAASPKKSRQEESRELAEVYSPILQAGGVCLSLGGHNHNYQRAEADGVCYVTTAGGGAPLYDVGEGADLKASRKAHHVCRLRARKKLTLEAIDLDGHVFDTWTHEAR